MWSRFKDNKYIYLLISYGSLFTSFGTLLCCALPSTLVLLGLGASLSNFLGVFPQLIWLSEHKNWLFGISFLLLALSYLAQRWSRNMACPIDKKDECESARKWSKPIMIFSLVINLVGATYAYVL